MKFSGSIKSITNIYKRMSNFGKILLFIALILILIVFFKSLNIDIRREGYETNNKFLFKTGNGVYDDFYSGIYDYLVFNQVKTEFEVGKIISSTNPTDVSVILDIGSGTGHTVNELNRKNLTNVMGIDVSPSMINEAKKNYPALNFTVGDALNESQFKNQTFTHILCLYFTIYYFKDKRKFFDNCMDWLMPGGYLILHLVDREKFDPILPPGNPLYIVSPQKYAKERITKTKITFNDFVYNSKFNFDKNNNIATFEEKFKFNDGKVRKQEQVLYMEDTEEILTIAQQCGFILQGKIDMVKCAYEHQYLYIFTKPS